MHETMIKLKLEEEMKPLKEICEKLLSTIKHEFEKGVECVDTEEMGDAIDMLKDVYDAKEKIAKACYYKKIVEAMEKSEEEEKKEDEYMLRRFRDEAEGDEDKARRYYDSWRYDSGRFAPKGRGNYRPMSYGRSRRGYTDMMMPMDYMSDMYDYDEMERMRDLDRDHGKMYFSAGTYASNYGGNSSNRSGNEGSDGRRNYGGEERGDGRRNENRSESRYDKARRGFEEVKMAHNSNTPEDKQMTMREAEKFVGIFLDGIEDALEDASPEVKALVKSKTTGRVQKW